LPFSFFSSGSFLFVGLARVGLLICVFSFFPSFPPATCHWRSPFSVLQFEFELPRLFRKTVSFLSFFFFFVSKLSKGSPFVLSHFVPMRIFSSLSIAIPSSYLFFLASGWWFLFRPSKRYGLPLLSQTLRPRSRDFPAHSFSSPALLLGTESDFFLLRDQFSSPASVQIPRSNCCSVKRMASPTPSGNSPPKGIDLVTFF